MKRHWIFAAVVGATLFATLDLALNALASWLAQNDLNATSAVVNELFLRVIPLAVTGLAAGYLALPRGFSAASVAGLTGAVISLALRSHSPSFWTTLVPYNTAAMVSWFAGMSIASATVRWHGEATAATDHALSSLGLALRVEVGSLWRRHFASW